MKRLATHRQPDGDALGSLWLAERFLFAGESVEIVFVSRGATVSAECVVDMGNEYDPARLRFDHKPPAFANRNTHCATELLWQYLQSLGKPVEPLAAWVAVVHAGDANPPRSADAALRESRVSGYHRAVTDARRVAASDDEAYRTVRAWLDAFFCRLAS